MRNWKGCHKITLEISIKMSKANIREIFQSIQGEGPHIGEQQLFIRFCGCNLHCAYCDTDFEVSKSKSYTPHELIDKVNTYGNNQVLSLTGGEPLVSMAFLKEFLPLAKSNGHKIYLETNATLPEQLENVIEYVDVVSADIKLFSATKEDIPVNVFDDFFKIASQKELFAKIVFNSRISNKEIDKAISLAKKYSFELILQPEMSGNSFCDKTKDIEAVFSKFRQKYDKVRIIPQMHKFLGVEWFQLVKHPSGNGEYNVLLFQILFLY